MAASIESRRSSSVRAKDNSFAIFEDEQPHTDSPEPPAKPEDLIDDVAKAKRSQISENEIEILQTIPYDVQSGLEDYESSEEDPFSETDDEDDDTPNEHEDRDLVEEQNGFIGNAPVYQISHSYDRSFSTTTAIHLEDPDHEYHEPRKSNSRGRSLGDYAHNLDGIDEDGPLRNVSETVSVMPDEQDLSGHRSSGAFPYDFHDRTPLSQSGRYNRLSDHFSPSPERKRTSRSPTKERMMSSAHSTHHGTGFRNTSSVKNMQLSSPSPTPFSSPPRSLSKRYGTTISPTRQYTPSRHSSIMSSPPRQHHEPQKEYPLVLLHCSISGAPIPYSQAALDHVLPPKVVGSVSLLREKLSATVIERGILIPHPGDDYELLEERVFESLELKRPRLGKCGHFNANATDVSRDREISGETAKAPAAGHDQGPEQFDGATACPDCGGHTCSEVSDSGCGFDRQWNIKVYAANGLMRSGAWTAAWREMEKVDVEVGVFIPDHYKRQLDAYATQEAKDAYTKATEGAALADESIDPQAKGRADVNAAPIPMSRQRSTSTSATESASTAACARRTSRQKSDSRPKSQSGTASKSDETPLSVLLERYLRRTLSNRPDFLIGILILVIGIWFSGRGQTAPAITSALVENSNRASTASANVATSNAVSVQSQPSTVSSSSVSEPPVQSPSSSNGLPACTFAYSEASLHGMTAVPADLASSILEESSAPLAQPSVFPQGASKLARADPEPSAESEQVSESQVTIEESQTSTWPEELQQTLDMLEVSQPTPNASGDEVSDDQSEQTTETADGDLE